MAENIYSVACRYTTPNGEDFARFGFAKAQTPKLAEERMVEAFQQRLPPNAILKHVKAVESMCYPVDL